jgi:hypothetical protein
MFDPGNGILDRFINVSYSWLNRNICTPNHWDYHFYILGSRRKDLLPIPQCTEDYTTINVTVMYGSQRVEQRIEKHHFSPTETSPQSPDVIKRGGATRTNESRDSYGGKGIQVMQQVHEGRVYKSPHRSYP